MVKKPDKKIRRIDFANMVVAWLGRAQTKQMLSGWLLTRLLLWLSKHGRLPDGALSRSSAFELKAESLRPISDYAIRAFYDFAKNPEFYQRVKMVWRNMLIPSCKVLWL